MWSLVFDFFLLLLSFFSGAFLFMSDLCKKLTIPHEVDFVALSSYGAKGSKRGEVQLRMDLRFLFCFSLSLFFYLA